MNNVAVREATEDDLNVLRQLEQELIDFERPFDSCLKTSAITYYDLPALISDSNSIVIVAESGSEVIASGYAQILESKPYLNSEMHCYLGFIYVKPEARGNGWSRKIVDSLTGWSQSRGVNHFLLDVYSENSCAINAYQRFGFAPRTVMMELVL